MKFARVSKGNPFGTGNVSATRSGAVNVPVVPVFQKECTPERNWEAIRTHLRCTWEAKNRARRQITQKEYKKEAFRMQKRA